MSEETKVLDEDGAILLTSNIKTLADATYPANAAVASSYNSSISYIVGSYCLHNGLLYKCNTDIPVGGEVWTAAHWTQVNLGNELALDRKMQFTDVVVDKASFVQDTTYEDFPYRAAIALTGVTASMYPEVVFDATDAVSGQFAPTVLSYNGGIYIYAKKQPSTSITIPSIVCWIRGIALDSAGSLNIADEIASIENNIDSIEDNIDNIEDDITTIQNTTLKMELLWTNASPTSAFATQKVTCDMSYDMYFILCISHLDSPLIKISNFLCEDTCTLVYITGSNSEISGSMCNHKRHATRESDGITFSGAYASTTSASWYAYTSEKSVIPYKIYGIKGVTTQ